MLPEASLGALYISAFMRITPNDLQAGRRSQGSIALLLAAPFPLRYCSMASERRRKFKIRHVPCVCRKWSQKAHTAGTHAGDSCHEGDTTSAGT